MGQGKGKSKNGNAAGPASILRAGFDDFDAFTASLKAWDLDFVQLDPGPFIADLAQITMPRSGLLRCSFARGHHQTGALPEGCRTFGIPLPGCPPFSWYGRTADDRTIMIFPKGAQLDSRVFANFSVITFSLEESKLERLADRENLSWVLEANGLATQPRADQIASIQSGATRLVEDALKNPSVTRSTDYTESIEEELAVMILEALGKTPPLAGRPMAKERSRVFKAALTLIEDCPSDSLQVSEICHLVGASSRTLRYAFEEKLGVSPKLYLKARRLKEVRRKLRQDDDTSVKEVAIDHGFFHAGQFAADYRRMFGELPSETLRHELASG